MEFRRATLTALVAGFVLAGSTSGRADVDVDARTKEVARSIAIVDFTIRNENSSREDSGQGLLLSKEGVILISGSLINEGYPKEWISSIKIRLPGNNFTSMPATLLGRTRDRLFAYLKTDKPVEDPPFVPGEMGPIKLGNAVFAVARMGTTAGYEPYIGRSEIRAIVDFSHTFVSTASFGLTRGTSPVFDASSGALVGLTLPAPGDSMIMRDAGGGGRRIELVDEDQSSAFLPVSDVEPVLKDIPTAPFDLRRPWLAVDEVKGLEEKLRTARSIQQPSGVIIGYVIPGEAADKAGLKAGDVILTVDGKEFSKSPVPDMMVMHFSKIMDKLKPGDAITLGILREAEKMSIPVTVGTSPRISAEMPHVFSSRLGLVTRDLVFADAYARKIPQDTKGVMVALVKSGSPAALSTTPLAPGYLITKVDDQPVEDQKQFLEILKQEEAKPNLKELVFVVIQRSGETQVCRIDLTK